MLTDFACLQQATIGAGTGAAAAGLPSWDPGSAADEAARQAHQLHAFEVNDPRHISAAQRDQILYAQPTIEAAARVVAASPVPLCLDHGDLWPGNIVPPADADSSHQFIDFGDAAWSHPFLSLIMLIIECRFRWAVPDQPDRLNINHPAITAITDFLPQRLDRSRAYARTTTHPAVRTPTRTTTPQPRLDRQPRPRRPGRPGRPRADALVLARRRHPPSDRLIKPLHPTARTANWSVPMGRLMCWNTSVRRV